MLKLIDSYCEFENFSYNQAIERLNNKLGRFVQSKWIVELSSFYPELNICKKFNIGEKNKIKLKELKYENLPYSKKIIEKNFVKFLEYSYKTILSTSADNTLFINIEGSSLDVRVIKKEDYFLFREQIFQELLIFLQSLRKYNTKEQNKILNLLNKRIIDLHEIGGDSLMMRIINSDKLFIYDHFK